VFHDSIDSVQTLSSVVGDYKDVFEHCRVWSEIGSLANIMSKWWGTAKDFNLEEKCCMRHYIGLKESVMLDSRDLKCLIQIKMESPKAFGSLSKVL